MKKAVEHALKCGDALNAAKSKVDAGTWLQWLASTGIKERTAQRYMKLAANREKLEAASDTMSGVTFNGAMALITERKESTRKSGGVQQLIDRLVETIKALARRGNGSRWQRTSWPLYATWTGYSRRRWPRRTDPPRAQVNRGSDGCFPQLDVVVASSAAGTVFDVCTNAIIKGLVLK
jgi:hypothetical protein